MCVYDYILWRNKQIVLKIKKVFNPGQWSWIKSKMNVYSPPHHNHITTCFRYFFYKKNKTNDHQMRHFFVGFNIQPRGLFLKLLLWSLRLMNTVFL